MKRKKISERLRLPQRISLLFFFCVMLPVASMVSFSVMHLEGELESQSVQRLRHQAKNISISIYERLLLLETEMRLFTSAGVSSADASRPAVIWDDKLLHLQGFENLAHLGPYGAVPLLGVGNDRCDARSHPWNTSQIGRAFIVSCPSKEGPPALLMAIATSPSESLIGQIREDFIWGTSNEYNLPPDVELCILDENNDVVISSIADPALLVRALSVVGHRDSLLSFTWRNDQDEFISTAYNLFLAARFSVGGWTVVLSQSKKSILASLRNFEMVFALVGVLMVLTALFFSLVSIRRSLAPLNHLRASTKSLAGGDFSIRTPLGGSPEFQELSDAFNSMSAQIEIQFKQLSLLAAIGQRLSSTLETQELAVALIDSIRRFLDFDRILFILADSTTRAVNHRHGFNFIPEEIDEFCRLFGENLAHSQINPAVLAFDSQKMIIWEDPESFGLFKTERKLDFYQKIGTQSLVCVPVVHEKVSVGVIVLVCTRAARAFLPNERQLLSGISATVAVCVSGIYSYQKLRMSEERFRKAFDHSAAGVALVSMEGRFIKVNRFLSHMLGYGEEDMLSLTLQKLTHADDQEKIHRTMQSLLANESNAAAFENRLVRKNGKIVCGLFSSSLLRDASGDPLYFVTHIQDITTQKEAQLESQNLEGQLRHAQKMEAIGTLAAGIAHDFNNVLSAIMGYTELAMLDTPEEGLTWQRLDKALQACNRASDLIKQILAFSRHSEEKVEPVHLGEVVKEALKLLRSTIPPHIALTQNISKAPYAIQADTTQIHQLVMNLCTNAYHAMMGRETGTISVALMLEKTPARSAEETKTYLKLTIGDSGCGMPPEVMERIFEPYFTTKTQGLGTGLGLSIVHGIVKKHGGEIAVQSKPGEGTTFEIHFPAFELQTNSPSPPAACIPEGKESILIVDDETEITGICQDMLCRQGYRVETKNDPYEALDEFQQNPDRYQLVITDLAMPGMTGERLATEICAIRPSLPIILCSGFFDEMRAQLTSPSIKEYLRKPVNLSTLAATVRRVIDAPQDGAAPPDARNGC